MEIGGLLDRDYPGVHSGIFVNQGIQFHGIQERYGQITLNSRYNSLKDSTGTKIRN